MIEQVGFYLQVAIQGVHSQNFGDEIVIVNLNTGKYYSLRGGAVQVWDLLRGCNGYDAHTIAKVAPFDPDSIDLYGFLTQLFQEGLLVESELGVYVGDEFPIEGKGLALGKIGFEIYDDMQSLLLLDPIHDVDAKVGWPKQK